MFLFSGSEQFLIRQEVQRRIDGFTTKFGDDAIVRLDIAQHDVETISQHCMDQGFFATKKMIVLTGLPYPPKTLVSIQTRALIVAQMLCALSPNPDTTIMLVAPSADKRTAVYKMIAAAVAKIYAFDPKKGASLLGWMDELSEGSLSSPQKDLLLQTTGGDNGRIYQEIAKWQVAKNHAISFDAVVYRDIHTSVFDFLDMVGDSRERAQQQRQNLYHNHKDSPAFQLVLGGLLRGAKTIVMTIEGIRCGLGSKELASQSGLHPFVTSKLLARFRDRDVSFATALGVYDGLVNLDYQLKRGMATQADFWSSGWIFFSQLSPK